MNGRKHDKRDVEIRIIMDDEILALLHGHTNSDGDVVTSVITHGGASVQGIACVMFTLALTMVPYHWRVKLVAMLREYEAGYEDGESDDESLSLSDELEWSHF